MNAICACRFKNSNGSSSSFPSVGHSATLSPFPTSQTCTFPEGQRVASHFRSRLKTTASALFAPPASSKEITGLSSAALVNCNPVVTQSKVWTQIENRKHVPKNRGDEEDASGWASTSLRCGQTSLSAFMAP